MSKKKCPICGAEMKIDTSAVCTSIPPKYSCVCPSCNCLDFIETSEYDQYKEEPSLTSNLDEAAEKVEDYYDVGEEHGYLYCHRGDIKDAFKAGAEWMAGQGVTVKKKIGKIDDGINQIPTYCNGFEITELDVSFLNSKECGYGDEVFVQIRKKQ